MKRILLITALVVLSLTLFCPGVRSETAKKGKISSSQDLLVKSQVETAVSMLQAVFARHQKGEMTLEQAKNLGADLLRELRYGTDGYFWADTTDGINVVLYGRKDVEGRNRIEDKDQQGTYYVKAFLAKAKAGGGYVEYWFTRQGQTKPLPKRSYVLPFAPFGWVVGTGYYR
jgi:methyl-accepting chemotaxis protein